MSVRFTSSIPQIVSKAKRAAAVAVETTAREIDAGAKERSRVDTGQMRGGWEAREREGSAGLGWDVVNPVEHTIYNELGTVHMPAQPMAGPAAEEARPRFQERMRRVVHR